MLKIFFESRAIQEIMWRNMVEPGQATDDNVALVDISCWIPKTKNTHIKYTTHIAFPPQEWLHNSD
jgi:hypothetical protein